VVNKLIHLRRHDHFGPAKISLQLKRYHDVEISNSGVWRILRRLDMRRLSSSQRYKRLDKRWQRYEKQFPGQQTAPRAKAAATTKIARVIASGRRSRRFSAGGSSDLPTTA
jgi:hypothetical protein